MLFIIFLHSTNISFNTPTLSEFFNTVKIVNDEPKRWEDSKFYIIWPSKTRTLQFSIWRSKQPKILQHRHLTANFILNLWKSAFMLKIPKTIFSSMWTFSYKNIYINGCMYTCTNSYDVMHRRISHPLYTSHNGQYNVDQRVVGSDPINAS